MDLEQRLKQLEGYHDWNGVVEALEQGIVSTEDASRKADYHLQLGRLLYSQFLQGVRALKHFQDAYKLNPTFVGALSMSAKCHERTFPAAILPRALPS